MNLESLSYLTLLKTKSSLVLIMTKDFTVIIWQEGSHYVSWCLELDISSFGNTDSEARINLQEAIELTLQDQDLEIPELNNAKLDHLAIKF